MKESYRRNCFAPLDDPSVNRPLSDGRAPGMSDAEVRNILMIDRHLPLRLVTDQVEKRIVMRYKGYR